MDVVWYKKPHWYRFKYWLARELTSIAYDISHDGFEQFVYDNDYAYCPDCDRARY